jgi:protein SCO1
VKWALARLLGLGLVLAVVLAWRAEVRSAPRSAAPGPPGLDTVAAMVAGSPRRFPNPLLVTQEGKQVHFYDDLVRGRVVMVNFAYTQCTGKCPRSTAQLVAAQQLLGERFGRDITLLTLSLDPEHDTPEAMSRYVAAHKGRPGWTWLTGRREDLEAIRRFVGFVDRDPKLDADRTRHTSMVLLGNDRTGRWTSVTAYVRPQLIVDAVLRTAGERPAPTQTACAK